jgi:hypothetical protein
MDAVETYRKLVREYADAGPFTLEGSSNHLPMALAALALDGAPAAALEQFARSYVVKLEPRRPPRPALLHSVQAAWDCRAQPARYWDVEAFFRGALRAGDLKPVLSAWLPRLLPGMAASAFHGLLRTAYAIRMEEPGEMAAGLAAWVTGFFAMPLPRGAALALPPQLERLDRAPALQPDSWSRPLIMGRLREVAGHAVFNDLLQPLPPSPFDAALQDMASHAVDRYAERLDVTVLHLVTAAHALTMLEPYLPEPQAALQALWPAYAGAWVVAGSVPSTDGDGAGAVLDWAEIRARAHASTDDHVVRAVFSCAELAQRWQDDRFRIAASRLVTQEQGEPG